MPLLVVCFSCQREGESQAGGFPGETVPEVSVMTVRSTQVPVTANLPGRMEAYLQAEVRARVTGIIQERCYQEGQTVRPGDLLFKIDPAPLQAVLDECKAAVARARASSSASLFLSCFLMFLSISQKQKPVMAEGMLAAMIIAVTSIGSPPLPLRPVLFV